MPINHDFYTEAIISIMHEPLIILDKSFCIITANTSFYKKFNLTHSEVAGKLLYELQDGSWNNNELRVMLEKVLLQKAVVEDFKITLASSLRGQHMLLNAARIDEENGPFILLAIKDISEKRIAKMKLEASEERYRRMVAEVQDYAILMLDKNGYIQNWNLGAEKIKGYKAEEIIGKHFSIFYPKKDRESGLPEKLLNEGRQTGKALHEGWRIRKDGTAFWGSIVITALHDTGNNVIGFTKVTRDLTERKMAEDLAKKYALKLEIQNKELQQSNSKLEQFAFIASHDLQEPLRKILIFSNLLQTRHEQDLSPDIKTYLSKIEAASERMRQLIQELLLYSRFFNQQELFEQTDLNEVLKNVLSDYELLIEQKNAQVKYDNLPVVWAVPTQMYQLFNNLINNSLKFSKNDVPPVIKINALMLTQNRIKYYPALNPALSYCEIIFKDNGIGFDQEYAGQVFIIFRRLDHSVKYEGTGIGLAICKKIIENHQGEIFVTAKENEGAEFHIILPLGQKES